jgi:hypothetical protein
MSGNMTCQGCGATLSASTPKCQYCGADNPSYVQPYTSPIIIDRPSARPAPRPPFVAPSFYAYTDTKGKALVILTGMIAVFFFSVAVSQSNMHWWWYAAGANVLSTLFTLMILIFGPLSAYWTLRSIVRPDWQMRPLTGSLWFVLQIAYLGMIIFHIPAPVN